MSLFYIFFYFNSVSTYIFSILGDEEPKLSADNQWVILAELIPWSEFEGKYAELFSEEMGVHPKASEWHWGH